MALSAGSSTGLSAAQTTMSIPPSLVQQIVDVKASLAAEKAADQLPAPSSSAELPFVALSSVPAIGGVPEDL